MKAAWSIGVAIALSSLGVQNIAFADSDAKAAPPSVASTRRAYSSQSRGDGEMLFLYGTAAAYGLGTGIWVDSLARISDPGLAFIAPLGFAAAAPTAVYFIDQGTELHRGVPSSIAAGMLIGGLEGLAIGGTQWQYTHGSNKQWDLQTQGTLTFLLATGGGVGGYFFGEAIRPDPRALTFIASGAGWGAITGVLFGTGVSGREWRDGASLGGLLGMNVGLLATGIVSSMYTPSWKVQKYMWAGYGIGTVASSFVYLFYLFSKGDPKHGMVANAVGGVAGLAIAGIMSANSGDDDSAEAPWKPPFTVGFTPLPNGGGAVNAFGLF